jgi:hypothetical protein
MGWVEAEGSKVSMTVMNFTFTNDVVRDETIQPWRLWRAKPDKIRTQFQVGTETVTAVITDRQWWSWTLSGGLRTNGGDPSSNHGHGPGDVLVETPMLISSLTLRAVERTTFLSRSAYRVTAQPARLDPGAPEFVLHGLGVGADRYELLVDAEVGVLLRAQAELGGEAFRVVEVDEFGFNETSPDEHLFTPESLALVDH